MEGNSKYREPQGGSPCLGKAQPGWPNASLLLAGPGPARTFNSSALQTKSGLAVADPSLLHTSSGLNKDRTAAGQQLLCVVLRRDRCLLLRQDKCLQGHMSAAETGQMSAVETRQVYSIKTGQRLVAIVDMCFVSTAKICPASAVDMCPVSTADICPLPAADVCPVSTPGICPVSTKDIWSLWGHLGGMKMSSSVFFHPKCTNGVRRRRTRRPTASQTYDLMPTGL